MGDAQPHSGVDGQRVCMRPYHQHDQDHGTAWTSQLDQVLLHLNLVFSALSCYEFAGDAHGSIVSAWNSLYHEALTRLPLQLQPS